MRMSETFEFEYVTECLSRAELLAQLAEEAAELAQAALKLRRVLDRMNPTPVSYYEAIENLREEIADVDLCIALARVEAGDGEERMRRKLERWKERLKVSGDDQV